jgi:hypothetical protein
MACAHYGVRPNRVGRIDFIGSTKHESLHGNAADARAAFGRVPGKPCALRRLRRLNDLHLGRRRRQRAVSDFRGTGIFSASPIPPPSSITVQIYYDPTVYVAGTTTGDTTTYQNSGFFLGESPMFSIIGNSFLWQGFNGNGPLSFAPPLTITAPPPGQGPDSMDFIASEGPAFSGYGEVKIFAPNGTLSSSTDLPATLDAFLGHGGTFQFSPPQDQQALDYIYLGLATGTLLPEPAAIVTMMIGLCVCAPIIVLKRHSIKIRLKSPKNRDMAR